VSMQMGSRSSTFNFRFFFLYWSPALAFATQRHWPSERSLFAVGPVAAVWRQCVFYLDSFGGPLQGLPCPKNSVGKNLWTPNGGLCFFLPKTGPGFAAFGGFINLISAGALFFPPLVGGHWGHNQKKTPLLINFFFFWGLGGLNNPVS